MTPVASIARCGDRILLDRNQRVVMALGADGAPRAVTIVDRPGRIVSYADGFDLAALERDVVVTAPPDDQAAHRARDPPPHRQPARAGRGRQAGRGDRRRRDLPRHPAPDRDRRVAIGAVAGPGRQGDRDEQGRSHPGVRALSAGVPGRRPRHDRLLGAVPARLHRRGQGQHAGRVSDQAVGVDGGDGLAHQHRHGVRGDRR